MIVDASLQGPRNVHSWGANLAWTLAHLKRGNSFIICSEILPNKQSTREPERQSAFARELCAALKAGYTLHKTDGDITLMPDGLAAGDLMALDTDGRPGNGIDPSPTEIDEIYEELGEFFQQELKEHDEITYTYSKALLKPRTAPAIAVGFDNVAQQFRQQHQQMAEPEARPRQSFLTSLASFCEGCAHLSCCCPTKDPASAPLLGGPDRQQMTDKSSKKPEPPAYK